MGNGCSPITLQEHLTPIKKRNFTDRIDDTTNAGTRAKRTVKACALFARDSRHP